MHCYTILSALLAASLVSAHPHQPGKRAVSPDGTCGPARGYTCPGSAPCCSQWGWCGSTPDYCAAGCQPAFGTCSGRGTPTQSPTASPTPSPTSPPNPGDVRSVPRTKVGPVPYGSVIYGCVRNGDIALTFDDGPYIYTPTVLDVLARYNAKATFFIVGSNGNGDIDKVAQWSSIVRRTFNEGHQIASHTWNHPDLTTISSSARREQMYLTETAIANILDGRFPTYMRPPYLGSNAAVEADMADLGYHVVSTNLDTKDYANNSPATIGNSQRIFDDFAARDPRSSSFIALNHDIHRTTAEILTEYQIQRLRSRGYRAVTVGDCLGDDPANWYRTVSRPALSRYSAEEGAEDAAIAEPVSSEELAAEAFAPPAAACYTVDAPNSIERLMRLV